MQNILITSQLWLLSGPKIWFSSIGNNDPNFTLLCSLFQKRCMKRFFNNCFWSFINLLLLYFFLWTEVWLCTTLKRSLGQELSLSSAVETELNESSWGASLSHEGDGGRSTLQSQKSIGQRDKSVSQEMFEFCTDYVSSTFVSIPNLQFRSFQLPI